MRTITSIDGLQGRRAALRVHGGHQRSPACRWHVPAVSGGRKTGQWIVGIGIGFHFNAYVIEQIAANFAVILAGALVTTAAGAIAVWWMRRGGEDNATAFFSSMPGGSAEMVNLGLRNGAVLHRVAAAQTLRVSLMADPVFRWLSKRESPHRQ